MNTGILTLLLGCAVALSPTAFKSGGRTQTASTLVLPLAGTWKVSLHEADGVELDFRMTFALTVSGQPVRWEAYSRQGAAREMVAGGTAAIGRLLGKMPPKEALVYIGDGVADGEGDTLRLTGEMESPFLGRRHFAGSVQDGRMRAELTRVPSGARAGTIEAVRDALGTPLRDYSGLPAELEGAIRANIFDPALPSQPEFRRFFQEFAHRVARSRDDLDIVGAFQALRPALGLSHFGFIRNPRLAARSLDQVIAGDTQVDPNSFVQLGFPAPDVAFLDVTKWDRVAPAIGRAFERIAATRTRVLILDIRGNPGGDATSMAPLAHLITEPATIGAFLGRQWYQSHRAAPSRTELEGMRTLASDTSPAQFLRDLREHGAIVGRVLPRAPHFSGPVYLLVDRGTGSASEPLAHALKVLRRATLVGERTAGSMLTALPHPLSDGWMVVIPEANFIAADGARLEGNGVEPHIKTEANQVFLSVADQIADSLPFSAEFLRGGSYDALGRPQDAERAYRAALRVADRQQPLPNATIRAIAHKRLAAILIRRGDRSGALREYGEVLKLVPDDAEALAAVRGGKRS